MVDSIPGFGVTSDTGNTSVLFFFLSLSWPFPKATMEFRIQASLPISIISKENQTKLEIKNIRSALTPRPREKV